jgi:DNA-binding IclR family transcriptional regulator
LEKRRQEILEVLNKLGPANLEEIAAAVNAPESNTANRLQMMVTEGQIKCLEVAGESRYSLESEPIKKGEKVCQNGAKQDKTAA